VPRLPNSDPPGLSADHSGTLLETDEQIHRALLASPKPGAPKVEERPVEPFRPTRRPPLALLTVCDDGSNEGEIVRIRAARFIVGRTQGDLNVPFDKRLSSQHVEITHHCMEGVHRWVVTDLQSRHGLFVRVSRALLLNKAEILVGKGLYRFEAPLAERSETGVDVFSKPDSDNTSGNSEAASAFRPPALTEILGERIGNRVVLVKPEYWIGSSANCFICRPEDPFCEPRHTRIYKTPKGQWFAEHNKSRNGLWLRMPQVSVETSLQFQIGEQRFRLRIQ
jgi:pSer/pThr/pTyr-binding forkhead associated (FHA) protein